MSSKYPLWQWQNKGDSLVGWYWNIRANNELLHISCYQQADFSATTSAKPTENSEVLSKTGRCPFLLWLGVLAQDHHMLWNTLKAIEWQYMLDRIMALFLISGWVLVVFVWFIYWLVWFSGLVWFDLVLVFMFFWQAIGNNMRYRRKSRSFSSGFQMLSCSGTCFCWIQWRGVMKLSILSYTLALYLCYYMKLKRVRNQIL